MNGPSEDIRNEVGVRARQLRPLDDDSAEAGLAELLDFLEAELTADVGAFPPEEDDPSDLAAAVSAWTSVVTFAVAEVYAPQSPWPRSKAGFSKDNALRRLENISAQLRRPLSVLKVGLGADSYSISVGFPFGISAGLTWS